MKIEKFLDGRVVLHQGDCLKVLGKIAADSVDSCACDPPYHLQSILKRFGSPTAAPVKAGKTGAYKRASAGFMGKQWDGGDIAFDPATWAKVLRVLKPGAFIVAFSSSRTFGRMSVALEDAGFITHPFIAWLFGSGFPKGHRVAASGLSELDRQTEGWDGWRYGTQTLKPAIEPIYVGQKPFEDGLNGWQNIQKWGVGALNVDGCRIPSDGEENPTIARRRGAVNHLSDQSYSATESHGRMASRTSELTYRSERPGEKLGRWPANVVHDGSDEVVSQFPEEAGAGGQASGATRTGRSESVARNYASGTDTAAPFYADGGSAARFFYTAKADSEDRIGSLHATVKPLDLMQWLVRLVTPPGGLVLDPFAGTGATGEAAFRERLRAVLIEREAEYCGDIRRRMKLAIAGPDERARESIKAKLAAKGEIPNHGPLFGGQQ